MEPPPFASPTDDVASDLPTQPDESVGCQAACEDKVVECGGPDPVGLCSSDICPQITSDSQIACLTSATCAELGAYIQFGDPVCGLGDPDPVTRPPGDAEGDACACDPTGAAESGDYGFCQSLGTCGFDFDNPAPGCLYDTGSREGTCILGTCSEADEFLQGSCGSGEVCMNSGARSSTGAFWYICG